MSKKHKMIAIMQPTYMPWLGYFAMMDKVEQFVFLDTVQIVGRSWQVRNKIKVKDEELLLTIPMSKELKREERKINNTRYCGNEWKENHLATIKMAYKKARFYEPTYTFLEELYSRQSESIGDFNSFVIMNIARKIGIETEFLKASNLDASGKKDELLVNLCKKVGAEKYLSAQGSASYIEVDSPGGEFAINGVELFYQNYSHPEYRQLGNKFIPYIGIYDLLFNESFENALDIIRSGNREDIDYKTYRVKYM